MYLYVCVLLLLLLLFTRTEFALLSVLLIVDCLQMTDWFTLISRVGLLLLSQCRAISEETETGAITLYIHTLCIFFIYMCVCAIGVYRWGALVRPL